MVAWNWNAFAISGATRRWIARLDHRHEVPILEQVIEPPFAGMIVNRHGLVPDLHEAARLLAAVFVERRDQARAERRLEDVWKMETRRGRFDPRVGARGR